MLGKRSGMKPTIQKKLSDSDTIMTQARLVNPYPKGSVQARAWSLRVVREAREAREALKRENTPVTR